MSIWTDSIEKTLNTIKNNTKKLSENYLGDYNTFKNRLMYINAPLVILSALNAYTVFELNSFSHIVQIGSVGTSVLIAAILGGEMCMGTQSHIEKQFDRFKDYHALQKKIENVLSMERKDRKIDPNAFMIDVYEEYKQLTTNEPYITKISGAVQNAITDSIEDIQTFVDDHWNILFRPYFRQIKKKNEKVIQALKETSQGVQETLETISEKVVKEPAVAAMKTVEPVVEKTTSAFSVLTSWIPTMKREHLDASDLVSPDYIGDNKDKSTIEMTMERLYPLQNTIVKSGDIKPQLGNKRTNSNNFNMNFQEKK